MPDIEFPVVIKHRPVDVHLNNVCPNIRLILQDRFCCGQALAQILWCFRRTLALNLVWPFLTCALYNVVQFINLVDDRYSSSLVWVFPGFYYPNVSSFLLLLNAFLFLLFLFLFYLNAPTVIVCDKAFVLGILQSLFDMESKREIIECVFS